MWRLLGVLAAAAACSPLPGVASTHATAGEGGAAAMVSSDRTPLNDADLRRHLSGRGLRYVQPQPLVKYEWLHPDGRYRLQAHRVAHEGRWRVEGGRLCVTTEVRAPVPACRRAWTDAAGGLWLEGPGQGQGPLAVVSEPID